ncbi:membrane protein involved in the export of O-antigen and teichoic acid [Halosimplex carlsbadense 2-9-1]|uniref:Membrane protein involved in the export of O-antigen and teichoic acid n=1 Tax=Halosimplex carlsbadense 2-9-1 TaxID=797114 RepID=M0D457_9EURY|nr:polysaccharide biosynthesis C-terminal domain-containing protein [Halosimplex carlsbadense]ELZ30311.1 membrane protein involved in the export of O-antigen and teichoic acid [Halosimplex carlsbadense 2-9-1]
MNLAKSSLKILCAKIVNSLSGFLAVVVFSRELGASPLGTYYPFIALLGVLVIPANFGISIAAEKRISEGTNKSEFLGAAILAKIPPFLFVLFSTVLFRNQINQYLGAEVTDLLIIALIIRLIGDFGIAVLRGEMRVGETAIARSVRPLGWLVFGYILYSYGHGIEGVIYGYICGSIGMATIAWLKVSVQPSWPSLAHLRSLLGFGRWSVIGAVGGLFYSWMDVLILTAFVSLNLASNRAEIGAYENAWRISLLVTMVSRAISVTIFPQVSQWDAENATEKIENLLPKAILPGLLVVFPAFSGTLVLSKDILRILFGPEFTVAWIALIILMGEKLFQSVQAIFGHSLGAINKPKLGAIATAIGSVLNIILNIVLISVLGITGAAIATAISFSVNATLQAHFLNRYINVQVPFWQLAWSLVASAVMGVLVYVLHSEIGVSSAVDLLLIVFVGAATYSSLILLYSPTRHEIQSLLQPVIKDQWI